MTNNYENQTAQNALTIEKEIDSLSNGHWDMFKKDYRSFWEHAKKISQLFKTVKPIKKEDREELWTKFSSACDEAKRKQQSEHQDRFAKSKNLRDDILYDISSAEVQSLFGFDPPDVKEMERLSQILKRAGQRLSEKKEDIIGEHKQDCFNRIQDVRRSHDIWWEELKRHRDKKQENFQSRVKQNLENNYERHRKATDALRACERNADELRDKISSAYNDGWASDARGWLSELEDKILDIERSIEKIEGWIQEDEEKLR